MSNTKNNLVEEYDVTRVIALILVVLGHCSYYSILTNYGGIDYLGIMKIMYIDDTMIHKILSNIVYVIYSFHMPLFVALSGALFFMQFSRNKFNLLSDLAKNKFFKLIIPFFLITLCYSVPIKLISGYYNNLNFSKIVKDIILGQFLLMGNSHLWYLPSLFIDFIIIYLIEKYCYRLTRIKIILLILIHFISFKIPIALIENPLKYAIWFYMGYKFEERRLTYNQYIKENKLPLIICIFIFILSVLLKKTIVSSSSINLILKEILNCFCAVSGSFIVYNISYLITVKTEIMNNKHIKELLINSFGIYLYSDPINYLVLFLFFKILTIYSFGNEILAFVIFLSRLILTVAISLFISKLLKKRKVKYIC